MSRKGDKAGSWKGGRVLDGHGYVRLYRPDHPFSVNGYVLEHRLIMEAFLGRPLLPTEVVHHINGDIVDNRIENLMLFASRYTHALKHDIHKKRWPNGRNGPEVHRESNRKWKAAHPEACRKARRKWNASHPDYNREYHRKRRAARKET